MSSAWSAFIEPFKEVRAFIFRSLTRLSKAIDRYSSRSVAISVGTLVGLAVYFYLSAYGADFSEALCSGFFWGLATMIAMSQLYLCIFIGSVYLIGLGLKFLVQTL